MNRMKTGRRKSKGALILRVLAVLLLAAFAAVFARQVLLCRSALDSVPMLLEYPELGESSPLTLEVLQRRVGDKAENSAAWQRMLEVDLPGGSQQLIARVALSNWGQVAGLDFVSGEFYPAQAVLLRQYQAVVPEGLAAAGDTFAVENVEYTVCGVYRPEGESAPVYLSTHPEQPNSSLTPTRMLLAQNDRLRLSLLYDLQTKANDTPKTAGVDLGVWRQLLRQEVYGVIFCCTVLLCACVLLRGYVGLVRLYGRWNDMLYGRKRALALHLTQIILAVAALNLAICGVNLPAELLAGPAETNPLQTLSELAEQSDYLEQAARSAKELAVLGLAAVLLFVGAVILWQLAGHIKRPDRNRKQSAFPEKEQASARWRYHAPTCPKKTTD